MMRSFLIKIGYMLEVLLKLPKIKLCFLIPEEE